MLRTASGITVTVGCASGLFLGARELLGRENFDRSMSFYRVAIPGYAIYKWTDWRTKSMPQKGRDARFEELHEKWASAALAKIVELRGFYIKVGQMGATNIGNAFPATWVRTLEVLQDNAPAKDIGTVRSIIEDEFGCPFDDLFEKFEEQPIGSASIGQVHRAVLRMDRMAEALEQQGALTVINASASTVSKEERGDGRGGKRSVVLKVQHPEVESYFRGDVRTIKWFCKIAQPEHVKALEELEKQFMTEFDYREEGNNLQSVRSNLSAAFPNVVLPQPFLHLCTKRCLVMEDVTPCTKLADALRADAGKVRSLITASSRAPVAAGSSGNSISVKGGLSAEQMDAVASKMAASISAANTAARVHNWAAGWALWGWSWVPYVGPRVVLAAKRHQQNQQQHRQEGHGAGRAAAPAQAQARPGGWSWWLGGLLAPQRVVRVREVLPLNHARVVDDLLLVHGHQILIDGCFNGDPHPGNFLIVHDCDPPATRSGGSSSGGSAVVNHGGAYLGGDRLGLIDFGQVKHLDLPQRLKFAQMVVALCVDDKERVVNALLAMGHRTKRCNPENLYTMAKLIYDSNDETRCKGKHIQALLDELQAKDPVTKVGEDYVMVGRVCIMLRGLGYILKQPRSTSDAWLPLAKRILVENGLWDTADDARIAARADVIAARRSDAYGND